MVIEAVFSGGVFKPSEEVKLPEGKKVEIEIRERGAGRVISLRGIWKGMQISDEEIGRARKIWEAGMEKQVKLLRED